MACAQIAICLMFRHLIDFPRMTKPAMLPSMRFTARCMVGVHVAITSSSVCWAIFSPRPATSEHTLPTPAPTTPSPSEVSLLKIVSGVYSGRGITPAACTADISFQAPVLQCQGQGEVVEAFRALNACSPEHVSEPHLLHVHGNVATVRLHQRYFGWLNVRSTLIVKLGEDGLTCEAFEERWNDLPLIAWEAARLSRRMNGILSSVLTPVFIR